MFTQLFIFPTEFRTAEDPGGIGHSGDGETEMEYVPTTTDIEGYSKVNESFVKSEHNDATPSTSAYGIDSPTEGAAGYPESKELLLVFSTENFDHLNYAQTFRYKFTEVSPVTSVEINVENIIPDQGFTEQTNQSSYPDMSEAETEQTKSVFNITSPPEDMRAISFQIPPPNDDTEEVQDSGKSGTNFMTEIKNPPVISGEIGKTLSTKNSDQNIISNTINSKDRINDRYRQEKSQLNPKSSKSFYEIKSLLTTEAPVDLDDPLDPSSHANVRKFILPTMASGMGKFGPYFEDGPEDKNITARIGSTVLLDCKIGMLHDKTVRKH